MTTCIILAGGLGTRLRSAVPSLPKCLAPISGKPFIQWQLQSLANRGINHFILALGYESDQVVTALSDSWANFFNIKVTKEPDLLGTGGAIKYAMQQYDLKEAIIANGDTFVGGSLSQMTIPLDFDSGEKMRIATVFKKNRSRFGGISVDNLRNVTAFLEKGQIDDGLINAGLYRVDYRVFELGPYYKFSMETCIMPKLVELRALQARELTGPFIDIGVPDDYHYFDKNVLNYVKKT